VMLTGTKSSLTCDHLTEPEEDVVTWNTSAQSLQMGMELFRTGTGGKEEREVSHIRYGGRRETTHYVNRRYKV